MRYTSWLYGEHDIRLTRGPNNLSELCLLYNGTRPPFLGVWSFDTHEWQRALDGAQVQTHGYYWPFDPPKQGDEWLIISEEDDPQTYAARLIKNDSSLRMYHRPGFALVYDVSGQHRPPRLIYRTGEAPT